MDKLLPCPFCGGDAQQEATGALEIRGFCYQSTWIECTKCGAEGQVFDSSDDGVKDSPEVSTKKAITAWNTRHTPEGWVFVPAEADDWMFQAFNDQHELSYNPAIERKCRPIHTWKRMLAAAPKWGGE